MKEKYYSRLGVGLLVIVIVLLYSIRSSAQIVVTELLNNDFLLYHYKNYVIQEGLTLHGVL